MSLTKEEIAELADLEQEEKKRLAEQADANKRQRLEALRMTKRLSAKHGVPGRDFVVLQTKVGNIAVRAPKDVEIDTFNEDGGREETEKLAQCIALEPAGPELQPLFAEHPALANALVANALDLLKVLQEENAKK